MILYIQNVYYSEDDDADDSHDNGSPTSDQEEGLIAVDESDEITIASLKVELEENKIIAASAVQISKLEHFGLERFGHDASMKPKNWIPRWVINLTIWTYSQLGDHGLMTRPHGYTLTGEVSPLLYVLAALGSLAMPANIAAVCTRLVDFNLATSVS
ncbi:hypothetical protein LSH36_2800g00000 [Paralvinella palmiformis]|uniref:Uncharacterized protein n=1 Tax=Paralvinella palmiformis TaxID=53620 RepID=A0AAD9IQ77_9ANNE|nr:hypothetical protein LSH36_2800g00000 [Paralvinella palmiformis]